MCEAWRAKRRAVYEGLFSTRALCAAGLAATPAFLFNHSLVCMIAQFLLFWFLAWLAGKRNKPLMTLVVMCTIVVFNLLAPYGRVLASLGPFRLTEGALRSGLRRAITLEGLIMLSRLTVRRDLRIPGYFGGIISESFRIFTRLTEDGRLSGRKAADLFKARGSFVGALDSLMLELDADTGRGPLTIPQPGEKNARAADWALLVVFVALVWALRR